MFTIRRYIRASVSISWYNLITVLQQPLHKSNFINYKKGALDLQPQVIKFTSCLLMVGGSLRVLRLPPPLKLSPWYSWNIAESGVKHNKSNQIKSNFTDVYPSQSAYRSIKINIINASQRPFRLGIRWLLILIQSSYSEKKMCTLSGNIGILHNKWSKSSYIQSMAIIY